LFNLAKEKKLLSEDFDFYGENYGGFQRSEITTDQFDPEELQILRSYEWDRINFTNPIKRKRYCEFRGITEEELYKIRKEAIKNVGVTAGMRKE